MANYIRELKLPGIGLKSESRRYYPAGEVSAHLVGVTGIDGHGLEGVERSYDEWLTGEEGKKTIRKDRYGRVVENIAWQDKQEGKSLQLTIDQRLPGYRLPCHQTGGCRSPCNLWLRGDAGCKNGCRFGDG